MVFGNAAPAGVAGENGGRQSFGQQPQRLPSFAGATSGPDDRSAGLRHQRRGLSKLGSGRSRRGYPAAFEHHVHVMLGELKVDGPFHARGPVGRGPRRRDGPHERARRFPGRADRGRESRHRSQHPELVGRFVDDTAAKAEIAALDLPGDVQDSAARGVGLDQRARGVAGAGAGAGQRDPEPSRHPRVTIRGVDGRGLMPHRHEPQVARHRLDERQVVHADDAEDHVHLCLAQQRHQQVASVSRGHRWLSL